MLDLPVVDADPIGRAVPELQHSMFFVHGLTLTPQVVVNEIGDSVVLVRVADGFRAEALVRALAVASRNLVWVADHAGDWSTLEPVVLCGAISGAQHMGAALRQARSKGENVAETIAATGRGQVLFRGILEANAWEDRDGFTVGDVQIEGVGPDEGGQFRVWYKNENMVAWRDGVPVVTVPDLIIIVGADGMPVTNPFGRMGDRVTVVGLPAPQAWRSERAVAVFGPRALGLGFDYVPLPQYEDAHLDASLTLGAIRHRVRVSNRAAMNRLHEDLITGESTLVAHRKRSRRGD